MRLTFQSRPSDVPGVGQRSQRCADPELRKSERISASLLIDLPTRQAPPLADASGGRLCNASGELAGHGLETAAWLALHRPRQAMPTRATVSVLEQSHALGFPGRTIESREPPPAIVLVKPSGTSSVLFQGQSLWSAAVSHSGCSGTVRRASGCSRWSESNLSGRVGHGAGRSG